MAEERKNEMPEQVQRRMDEAVATVHKRTDEDIAALLGQDKVEERTHEHYSGPTPILRIASNGEAYHTMPYVVEATELRWEVLGPENEKVACPDGVYERGWLEATYLAQLLNGAYAAGQHAK